MPLHILKLCVGIDEPGELVAWHRDKLAEREAAGEPVEIFHTTRAMPRRRAEILAGGSLYWVIRGAIQLRQPILDLRPARGSDGIERCRIVLEPRHILTVPAPRRPFQGWRYLDPADAPRDLGNAGDGDAPALPPRLHRELAELGLL
jgi:hypothetical protein